VMVCVCRPLFYTNKFNDVRDMRVYSLRCQSRGNGNQHTDRPPSTGSDRFYIQFCLADFLSQIFSADLPAKSLVSFILSPLKF